MMQCNLILPKRFIRPDLSTWKKLYFLGWPIRGGWDRQATAIRFLAENDPGCYIICPCRYGESHPLFQYWLPDESIWMSDEEKNQYSCLPFPSQTLWERYYLEMAWVRWSIIFWLAEEDSENPRKKEEWPYGRDTYGELGEWRIRTKFWIDGSMTIGNKIFFVLWWEKWFHGIDVIEKNYKWVFGNEYTVFSTLEETCMAGIEKAHAW